jgi:hypothetical protein
MPPESGNRDEDMRKIKKPKAPGADLKDRDAPWEERSAA